MLLPIPSEPPMPPLIQIVIEEKKEEPEKEELTVEEKIERNYYECDESVEYIRADNAKCIPRPRSVSSAPRATLEPQTASKPTSAVKPATGGNTYVYGYCTWWTKNQLPWVPNGLGNANTWASRASAMGYTVSNTPTVGSVAQTSSGPLGHVAVVTAVNGNTVTISEMNYNGWGVVNSRVAPISSFVYIR